MSPQSPSVLVFTFSEHGQANVNLATSYELALAGANVHIASFAPLKDRVSQIQKLVVRDTSRSSGSITFHECKGVTSHWQRLGKHDINDVTLTHSPDVWGASASYTTLAIAICPWSREEYLAGIDCIKKIIATVHPNVVVVDTGFYLARDACTLMGQKFIVILPNSIADVATSVQPHFAALWKYPIMSSGFSFPLKWWQIPLNVYLQSQLAIRMRTSVHFQQIRSLRQSLGLEPMYGPPRVTHICPALVEIDFPLATIPEVIHPVGPIIMPFDPLDQSDPALMEWLDNGPTVLINLGSHVVADAKLAREIASAIRILLDCHDRNRSGSIQVLWKARANGDIQTVIDEIIGMETSGGRVKVVAWLDAEPVAILQHPNLVCTVHHGGANSFYEGIWSGVPHIVLPVWFDTYQYAARVEYLNIGIFASKRSAPGVLAEELGPALVRMTGDSEEAIKFRLAAKHLEEFCKANGNGRQLSAMVILKEVITNPN